MAGELEPGLEYQVVLDFLIAPDTGELREVVVVGELGEQPVGRRPWRT
jgi:hypothetical protein